MHLDNCKPYDAKKIEPFSSRYKLVFLYSYLRLVDRLTVRLRLPATEKRTRRINTKFE